MVLGAIAVLVVNDHWAKGREPGWLTGKASDAAGTIVVMALLLAGLERWRQRRGDPGWAGPLAASVVLGAVAVTVVGAKATVPGAQVAGWIGGVARWPLDAGIALVGGSGVPPLSAIGLVADPTDVLAVLAGLVVVLITVPRRRAAPSAPSEGVSARPRS